MKPDAMIQTLVECGAIRFGDFTTKSGRKSPYFVDVGKVCSGKGFSALTSALAQAIQARFPQAKHLFGPAYKAIPIAAGVAIHLGSDMRFTYNRKEKKDHGEGGVLVGHTYTGGEKVVIVEDVLTAGTSIRDTINLLKPMSVEIIGAVVVVDRAERDPARPISAREAIEKDFGIPIEPLLHVSAILDFALRTDNPLNITDADRTRIDAYRAQYAGSQSV